MREQRPTHYGIVHFLAALLIGCICICWLIWGWKIGGRPGFPTLLPEAPLGALKALMTGIGGGACLLISGCWVMYFITASRRSWVSLAALSFLCGSALGGIVLGFLGFVRVGPATIIAVPVAAAVLIFVLRRPPAFPRVGGLASGHFLSIPFLLLAGLAALAPAVESDGIRYHLVAPQEWVRAGHFVSIPYNANSNLPGMQSLLAASLEGNDELGRVYQLLSWFHFLAFVVVAGELTRSVYRQFSLDRGGERAAAGIGAALATGLPVASVLAAWPFSDVAGAAHLLAAIWVLAPGTVRTLRARLAIASLLLGAALAVKISLLPLACLAGMWGLVMIVRGMMGRRRQSAGLLLAALLIPGALVLGPWLVKNTLAHGNPVYPIAWGVFGGEEWSQANEDFYKSKMKEKGIGHGPVELLRSPIDVTWRWDRFEGFNPGPAPIACLLVAVAVLGFHARRLRRLPLFLALLLAAGWMAWFLTYQSVRFALPLLVLVCCLGAGGLLALRTGPPWSILSRAALLGLALAGAAWTPVYHLSASMVYAAALGRIGGDVYLNSRFDSHDVYTAIQWLNQESAGDEPVLYIGEHRMAYARTYRPVSSDWFDTPMILVEIRATADNDAMLRRWRDMGMRHVLLNLGELALYEQSYFRPRFTPGEWARFEDVRSRLLEHVVYDTGRGAIVVRLPDAGH